MVFPVIPALAARDMHHAEEIELLDERQARTGIQTGRCKKFFTESLAKFRDIRINLHAHHVKAKLTNKGITI